MYIVGLLLHNPTHNTNHKNHIQLKLEYAFAETKALNCIFSERLIITATKYFIFLKQVQHQDNNYSVNSEQAEYFL